MHQVVPAIPPWVGTFVSQSQSRPQNPRKLPLPQLLRVVAPVLRPTFCTLQLSMGPPVTFQPGTPASLRLQTLGAQPPTRLHSWTCSLAQEAQDTQQRCLQHPLPRTSSKGAPSPYPTLGLGPTWMWALNQCSEPLLDPLLPCPPPQISTSLPPGLYPPYFHWPHPPHQMAALGLPYPTSHFDFTPTPLWLQSSG